MSWETSALFYHIYPLGLCGAPWENPGGEPVSRINCLYDWIPHLKNLHVNAIYFSPLWESGTHGYDTHDYTQLDRRLGTNADFARLCDALHANGIRVVIDGVFNHVGRGFFAFQDVLKNGQSSPFISWPKTYNVAYFTASWSSVAYRGGIIKAGRIVIELSTDK